MQDSIIGTQSKRETAFALGYTTGYCGTDTVRKLYSGAKKKNQECQRYTDTGAQSCSSF